jgi:hypothetical protein
MFIKLDRVSGMQKTRSENIPLFTHYAVLPGNPSAFGPGMPGTNDGGFFGGNNLWSTTRQKAHATISLLVCFALAGTSPQKTPLYSCPQTNKRTATCIRTVRWVVQYCAVLVSFSPYRNPTVRRPLADCVALAAAVQQGH